MKPQFLVVLVIGLSLSGCPGKNHTDGGMGDGGTDFDGGVVADGSIETNCVDHAGGTVASTLTVEAFQAAYLASICDTVFACPEYGDDFTFLRGALVDAATCVTDMGVYFEDDATAVRAAITAGDVVYDAAAAADCIEALGACALWFTDVYDDDVTRIPACAGVFVGQLGEKDACSLDAACGPGLHCVRGTSGCDGSCEADASEGGECLDSSECGPGQICSYDANDTCARVSVAYACGMGSACGTTTTGTAAAVTICPPGLACIDGSCSPPFAIGAECDDAYDAPCVAGYECLPDGLGANRCIAVSTTATEGATCGFEVDASIYCDARADLFCSDLGECTAFGTKDGDACDPYFDFGTTCSAGLYCDYDTSLCAAEKGVGDACSDDGECASHSCDVTCAANYCGLP